MIKLFPWQKTQIQQIIEMSKQKRLPHALLLSGPDGIGKIERRDPALCCRSGKAGSAFGRLTPRLNSAENRWQLLGQCHTLFDRLASQRKS